MSCTFTLSDHSSVLSANFYPSLELEKNSIYGLGLLGFYTYNSIFNIDENNNLVGFGDPDQKKFTYFRIKPGAYEIDEIHKEIQKEIKKNKYLENINEVDDVNKIFSLEANNNTLKCQLKSTLDLDFSIKSSLGRTLGFEEKVYKANMLHESTLPVDIMKVRMIRVDCNIISGAYLNSTKSHTLFEFDIDVEPGYKLSKEPHNIIYMPIQPIGRQFIDNITLRILDDQGDLVNFQGEKIIIKLELKKII